MSYSSNWRDLISSFGYGYVDDVEQYKKIVKGWAYTDMQPRTLTGLGDFRRNQNNDDRLNRLLEELAVTLFNFVTKDAVKNEEAFDLWHKDHCTQFIKKLTEITKGHDVDEIAFGKAQKIINVSFKYIYCLKDAEKYVEKFNHCHMVLDSYTYSDGFYKQEVIPWYNSNGKSEKLKKSELTSWSNLKAGEYIEIQNNIRAFLNDTDEYVNEQGTVLTPFQAEFYIFNKYQALLK